MSTAVSTDAHRATGMQSEWVAVILACFTFADYLYQNYRRTKTFPTGDEVWERSDPLQPVARP